MISCVNNRIEEIKKIVNLRAKFQKVMLLFDSNVSSFELREIYEGIKDICVYNQSEIFLLDQTEIYNGYKLIIYFCSADSYIHNAFNNNEFINIFIPTSNEILPFYLSENCEKNGNENYILLSENTTDFAMMPSICFNKFYNYFLRLVNGTNEVVDFSFFKEEITNNNIINSINKINEQSTFLDIDILKKQDIPYSKIIFIDLMLIDAFMIFLSMVKNNQFMIIDVYKLFKDDDNMIEKFYKLYNNDIVINFILLNYNCLFNYCAKTKERILEFIQLFSIEHCEIIEYAEKLKQYAKNDNGLVAYLYLYNILNV